MLPFSLLQHKIGNQPTSLGHFLSSTKILAVVRGAEVPVPAIYTTQPSPIGVPSHLKFNSVNVP
jgi:hypothetical protein